MIQRYKLAAELDDRYHTTVTLADGINVGTKNVTMKMKISNILKPHNEMNQYTAINVLKIHKIRRDKDIQREKEMSVCSDVCHAGHHCCVVYLTSLFFVRE